LIQAPALFGVAERVSRPDCYGMVLMISAMPCVPSSSMSVGVMTDQRDGVFSDERFR